MVLSKKNKLKKNVWSLILEGEAVSLGGAIFQLNVQLCEIGIYYFEIKDTIARRKMNALESITVLGSRGDWTGVVGLEG